MKTKLSYMKPEMDIVQCQPSDAILVVSSEQIDIDGRGEFDIPEMRPYSVPIWEDSE